MEIVHEPYNLQDLIRDIQTDNLMLPSHLWAVHFDENFVSVLSVMYNTNKVLINKSVTLMQGSTGLRVKVDILGPLTVTSKLQLKVTCINDLSNLLNKLETLKYQNLTEGDVNANLEKTFERCTNSNTQNSEHKENDIVCFLCKQKFSNDKELRQHELLHIYGNHFKCTACNGTFQTLSLFIKHKKNNHPLDALIMCHLCRKSFVDGPTLRVHLRTHTNRSLECAHCDSKFQSRGPFLEHQYTHKPKAPYACKVCKEHFTRKVKFQKHLHKHQTENTHLCNICGNLFPSHALLQKHRLLHFKSLLHKCHLCKKSFEKRITLISHLQTHANNRVFSCSKCKISFKVYNSLVAHQLTHRNTRYTCNTCNQIFLSESALSDHECCVENVYKCNVCDKVFPKQFHLKIHLRTHTNTTNFVCNVCNKSYSTLGNLNNHFKKAGHV